MKTQRIVTIIALILLAGVAGWAGLQALNKNNGSSSSTTANQSNPPTTMTNESNNNPTPSMANTTVSSGTFNFIDATHNGSGKVEIIRRDNKAYVSFKDDFKVISGPDLFIYLSSEQEYQNTTKGVDTNKTVNVGKLKSINGAQEYEITEEQLAQYGDAVIIWCRQFEAQFSRAELS